MVSTIKVNKKMFVIIFVPSVPAVKYVLPYIDLRELQLIPNYPNLAGRYSFNDIDDNELDNLYLQMRSFGLNSFVDLYRCYHANSHQCGQLLGSHFRNTYERIQGLEFIHPLIKEFAAAGVAPMCVP